MRNRLSQPVFVFLFLTCSFLVLMGLGTLTKKTGSDSRTAAGAFAAASPGTELGSLLTEPDDVRGAPAIQIRPMAERQPQIGPPTIPAAQPRWRCNYDFSVTPTRWAYLGEGVREELTRRIDADHGWREIILHVSDLSEGDPRYIETVHQTLLGIEGGMAYHVLIAPRPSDRDGMVVSSRLRDGGEAVARSGQLHVCLAIADEQPRYLQGQFRALHELVTFLRARIGDTPLILHGGKGGCIDHRFPADEVREGLNPGGQRTTTTTAGQPAADQPDRLSLW